MKKLMVLTFLACSTLPLLAQNLTGTWQGTLQVPQAGRSLRIVFKISRADDESLKATMYSIDQGGQPLAASAAAQQGTTVKLTFAGLGISYEGKLAADGNSIAGNLMQGGPLPLTLLRATPQTAWEIPEPAPPPRQMPANANPSFEVATIKPANPATPGKSMLVGRGGSNLFTTTNSTLADLIVFAYGLHARQVTGGPGWVESEMYDISGKPDQAGAPNMNQLRAMVQKFLADRFQLTFHKDKKELSAYVITVAKTGSRLSKTQANTGSLPGFGGRGPGDIVVRNSNMADFASFLQSQILDRPVVDQTGLADRYDFTLKWTPDRPQTAVPGASPTAPPDNPDAPPDLFSAIQQQLGLKLESTKTPVEVLVIDKVEKPSAN